MNVFNINQNYFYFSMHRVALIVLFLMVLDCSMDHVDAFNPINFDNTTGFSNGYYGYSLRRSLGGPITRYSISERSETGKNTRNSVHKTTILRINIL